MLVRMNASVSKATVLAVVLPLHALLVLSAGLAVLILLVYIGIALPAIWSVKPARRKAAVTVLGQILAALRRR